jgi:hypothetical protein
MVSLALMKIGAIVSPSARWPTPKVTWLYCLDVMSGGRVSRDLPVATGCPFFCTVMPGRAPSGVTSVSSKLLLAHEASNEK